MTERKLPQGWTWTTLGEVAEVVRGVTYSKSESSDTAREGMVPLVRATNVSDSLDTESGLVYVPSSCVSATQMLRANDIVLAASSGSVSVVGKSAQLITDWDGTFGAFCAVLRPHAGISPKYLALLVKSDEVRSRWSAVARGTNINNLKRGDLVETPVPLPPLPEQHRIVEDVEDHLSRLDAAEGTLRPQLIRARNLLDRQLAAAVNEAGGTSVRVAEVLLRKPANGRSVPTADVGFPVLRLTALRDGVIDLAERKIGEWSAADAEKFLVNRGDILMSRGNGSLRLVGRAGIVHAEPDPVAYPDTMIRLVPDVSQVLPEYLVTLWNSRIIRSQIESAARTTAGIYKVNQSIVSNILIPLPPLERQQQVVSEVGEVADAVRRLTTEIESAASRSAALRRSLFRVSFNGALVDQDPTDEPADVALAKIREQKSDTVPRRRRKAVAGK